MQVWKATHTPLSYAGNFPPVHKQGLVFIGILGNRKHHCQFLPQEVLCLILIKFLELFRTTALLITSANWKVSGRNAPLTSKRSRTAKPISLFLTSTHTSHGIDYCQGKVTDFINLSQAQGQQGVWLGKGAWGDALLEISPEHSATGEKHVMTPPRFCRHLMKALWTASTPHLALQKSRKCLKLWPVNVLKMPVEDGVKLCFRDW